jgi:YesN/AraC family two-component response regulator
MALQVVRAHPAPIHLLVTDLVMPGMTGVQLALALLGQRPGLRVLYVSGYPDSAVVGHVGLQQGLHYLQKPFALAELARKVRELLDEPAGPARAPGKHSRGTGAPASPRDASARWRAR